MDGLTEESFRGLFEELIKPLSFKEFNERVFRKKANYFPAREAGFFSRLFTTLDADYALSGCGLSYPSVKLFNQKKILSFSQYVGETDPLIQSRIIPDKVYHLHRQGALIIFDSLDDYYKEIPIIADGLEKELFAKVQINAYLYPAHAIDAEASIASCDVFIIQQEGTRTWTLWNEEESLSIATKKQEITLTQGDVLYVPKGCLHASNSLGGQSSLHLTFAFKFLSVDGLFSVVLEQMENELEFRKSLPPGFHRKDILLHPEADKVQQKLDELKEKIIHDFDVNKAIFSLQEKLITHGRSSRNQRIEKIAFIDLIDESSQVFLSKKLVFKIDKINNLKSSLAIEGKVVQVPEFVESILKILESGEKLSVVHLYEKIKKPRDSVIRALKELCHIGLVDFTLSSNSQKESLLNIKQAAPYRTEFFPKGIDRLYKGLFDYFPKKDDQTDFLSQEEEKKNE